MKGFKLIKGIERLIAERDYEHARAESWARCYDEQRRVNAALVVELEQARAKLRVYQLADGEAR